MKTTKLILLIFSAAILLMSTTSCTKCHDCTRHWLYTRNIYVIAHDEYWLNDTTGLIDTVHISSSMTPLTGTTTKDEYIQACSSSEVKEAEQYRETTQRTDLGDYENLVIIGSSNCNCN